MPYQMSADKNRARYNTPHKKVSLKSEIDSLNFDESMDRQQIQNQKDCQSRMVEYLKNIIPQQVDGFHTELNKI